MDMFDETHLLYKTYRAEFFIHSSGHLLSYDEKTGIIGVPFQCPLEIKTAFSINYLLFESNIISIKTDFDS